MEGLNLLNNVASILMRFRLEKLIVVDDIDVEMFHQIRVREIERDALRFIRTELPDRDSDYQIQYIHSKKIDLPCMENFELKKSALDKSDTLDLAIVETID